MTIAGIILLVLGGAMAALDYTGAGPAALHQLPVPFLGWVAAAGVGAILIFLNRRPSN